MEGFFYDLRYAVRILRNSPGFTLVALITLALAIGANTAVFSVFHAVLLHPLPYREPSQLVNLWEQNPEHGWYHNIVSAANFLDWRKQNHVFSQMAAMESRTFNLSGTVQPVEVSGQQVSANFFSVLGVSPALGRTFLPEEDVQGKSSAVVISNGIWERLYGGDTKLLGKQISLNGDQFTVVGIMPAGFYFPAWYSKSDVWIAGLDLMEPDRTWHNYHSIGRLRPGVTLKAAQAEMDTLTERIVAADPSDKGWSVQLVSFHDEVAGNTRPVVFMLLATVAVVLLIACANLTSLQLSRLTTREKEIAARVALGASRFRLTRQFLTESVLLSILGGTVGLVLAAAGTQTLVRLAPPDTPGIEFVHLNAQVLAFTILVCLLTGIVLGIAPALGAGRAELSEPLKEAFRGVSIGIRSQQFRRILVVSELALALILLVSAGLLVRSFLFLNSVKLGFNPHNVLTMRIPLEGPRYQRPEGGALFFHSLLEKVEALPGITSAAALDDGGLPPAGGNGMDFFVEGRPDPQPNQRPDAVYRVISPDYFRVMQIPLVRGRYFSQGDQENAPRVAIIDEQLAREYWPQSNPLGQRVRFRGLDPAQPHWFSIVGMVGNVLNRGVENRPDPTIYICYRQQPAFFAPRTLLVRTAFNPTLAVSTIRHEVLRLDPAQPISEVVTLDDVVGQGIASHRFPMVLVVLFAIVALILATIGTFGVLSYTVAQRTREMGIRMALGAESLDILRLILKQGIGVTFAGVALGLLGALGVTRLISSLLYGVRSVDVVAFTAAPVCLIPVALLASYIPARRAAKLDPMVALRYE